MSEYSTMMKQILKLKEINKELNYKLDKIEEVIENLMICGDTMCNDKIKDILRGE